MAENQELTKPQEKEVPVLTVLKNNCILKNIYLLNNPPSVFSSLSLMAENSMQESEMEETLIVGRHPDCNIKLEHPSISRFHLRIHSKPSSRSLSVTDLSSVHGTWISGKKIDPEVRTKLNEGDTLQLGGSSRLYRIHWVPLSSAYDIDKPFVPQLEQDAVEEETEEAKYQDENSLFDQVQNLEGLEHLFSDENLCPSVQEPSAPLMPDKFSDKEVAENKSPSGMFNEENEISRTHFCQLDKENNTPRALFPSVRLTASEMENVASSGVRSEKKSNPSIWSRRGKSKSVQVETSQNRGKSVKISPDLDEKDLTPDEENYYSHSLIDNLCPSVQEPSPSVPLMPDKFFDKEVAENRSPSDTFNDENEISRIHLCQLDKENSTPISPSVSLAASEMENVPSSGVKSEKKSNLSIWSRRGKSKSVQVEISQSREKSVKIGSPVISLVNENYRTKSVVENHFDSPDPDEQIFTPDEENCSPHSLIVKPFNKKGQEALKSESILNTPMSSLDLDGEEIFTPDKENMTPNTRLFMSINNIGNLNEAKDPKFHGSSPLKRSVNCNMYQEEATHVPSLRKERHGNVLQERKSTSSASKSHASSKKKHPILKARAHRDPFRPLSMNSSVNKEANSKPSVHQVTTRSGKSIKYSDPKEVIHPHNNTKREENKRWTIVIDTACLLNKNSRKDLQLLRGLKGTGLIIPRIVVRELDCMLRRGGFFRRMTEASAALQWIEDCMANAKWWIHVQSSSEEGMLIPPTPPASSHWFSEDKGGFNIGSNPFSPYSLHEIVTPTTNDHILECALFFKRTMSDGLLVLLSNDVSLKIKAMAEGVICETAEEFRGSLVNPFSERFLYTDSSPRGATWSCIDDAVLKEKYYPSPSKQLSKSGEVKGLKLILLHNSNFRQNTDIQLNKHAETCS